MNTILSVFRNRFKDVITKSSVYGLLMFVAGMYLVGLGLLIVEPDTYNSLESYTWWFFVTVTTVGYGDLYPSTLVGRVLALVVMFGGIGTIATLLGKFSDYLWMQHQKRLKGKLNFKNKMKNHTVIVGYKQNVTEEIIEQLRADNPEEEIIVCDSELTENVDYDTYDFVRGEIVDDSVLERCAIKDAKRVLIVVDDDNKTITSLLACIHANDGAKMVVSLNNSKLNTKVRQMARESQNEVEIVNDVRTPVMLQALQDPGTSVVVNNMLDNTHDDTIFVSTYDQSESKTVRSISNYLKNGFDATLIAINNGSGYDVNPKSNIKITENSKIYYISRDRIPERAWAEMK